MAILDSPADMLAAAGAGWLFYRAYSGLSTQRGGSPEDVAAAALRPVSAEEGAIFSLLNLSHVFDFDRARACICERGDAQASSGLAVISGILALSTILARRAGPAPFPVVLAAFVAAVVMAWAVTKAYRLWWRKSREPWWLDRSWLAWLVSQIADPLAQHPNPSQDLALLARASPHPDLDEFMRSRFAQWWDVVGAGGGQVVRETVERWIVGFARGWNYRFKSREWQEWDARISGA